jgi:PhoH-like ATPase
LLRKKSRVVAGSSLPSGWKHIVPDTNVFHNDPDAIEDFGENEVDIPVWVIEELDGQKREMNGVGAAARAASNAIYQYLKSNQHSSLGVGVRTKAGGILKIVTERAPLPASGLTEKRDRYIVESAYRLHLQNQRGHPSSRREVELVTNDVNMILIASTFGIYAREFERAKVVRRLEDLYAGVREFHLPEDDLSPTITQDLFSGTDVPWENFRGYFPDVVTPHPNEGYVVGCGWSSEPALFVYKHAEAKPILRHVNTRTVVRDGRLRPKNSRQALALALLRDPDIALVTLTGVSGSGKTLLALLAGLDTKEQYEQIMVFRPVVEPGESLGYLPGTLEEKFAPWALPIVDNLELILSHRESIGKKLQRHFHGKGEGADGELTPRALARLLIRSEEVTVEPINHLRGRSLHRRFIIFDEAQNFTLTQIKLGVTRAGVGSKVVLTGDLAQVDLNVHSTSSGLAALIEHMKCDETFGHIELSRSERSYLAEKVGRM